ncbi:hypothetical protein [Neorhizobium galegae]|uniref:hypothetical protein n=1 Tax=Neorhizobium galegae TaxID=399 RepID=UPI000621D8AF|nr:hypothetical protein [Neorhizobium galegae]KAB1124325.1 hypothetical protein F4V90_11995 [Neorhizobium galegae]MCQ1809560.1 hypothetical protein [Neorhizobium galegae]CDZ57509.1 Hypothetical protein NGAL_HAMBI2566_20640 [Neorhizobium galegae bv. orientalis]
MKYLHLLALSALFAAPCFPQSKPAPAPSGIYVTDPAHSSEWGFGLHVPVVSDKVTILIETELAARKKATN